MHRVIGSWPNLFVVGAMKAGTTSLHSLLAKHPLVHMAREKEPHFFSSIPDQRFRDVLTMSRGGGPQAYRAHGIRAIKNEAAYLRLFREGSNLPYRGESSASYLWDQMAAGRIYEKSPDSRIIILLRNPIERAFSHYLMDHRNGRISLSFEQAVKENLESLGKEKQWGRDLLYVELGHYAKAIQRYLFTFGPERVMIRMHEQAWTNIEVLGNDLAKFLQLAAAPWTLESEFEARNAHGIPRGPLASAVFKSRLVRWAARRWAPPRLRQGVERSLLQRPPTRPEIPESIRSLLWNHYADDIQQTSKLVGEDLGILWRPNS